MSKDPENIGQVMRVAASFGARFELTPDGPLSADSIPARPKGKKLKPVAGDFVRARPLRGEKDWQIEEVLERASALDRTDTRGRRELLAANVSMMAIVLAPQPQPDLFIADRYLAAAELMPCKAAIVWNKSDIAPPDAELEDYRALGYDVVNVSTKNTDGIDALREIMRGELSILVGQSGVGKSTIVNTLSGGDIQRTGSVSGANLEGRHTTVSARLIMLDTDIQVIDSPGVRDYAPGLIEPRAVAQGFREIHSAAAGCRFCTMHAVGEPDCEVKARVSSGEISDRRYRSYLRLAQINRQLGADRY
ncbi:MAG: ribosome small subunit-dependent GTPase A [Pseudomonadota bacterium]